MWPPRSYCKPVWNPTVSVCGAALLLAIRLIILQNTAAAFTFTAPTTRPNPYQPAQRPSLGRAGPAGATGAHAASSRRSADATAARHGLRLLLILVAVHHGPPPLAGRTSAPPRGGVLGRQRAVLHVCLLSLDPRVLALL